MQVIGACGLSCSGCKAYMATQANDLEKLAELAKAWGKQENPYTVEDMKCDGCLSDRVYKGCVSCGIRNCALEHDVKNCGACSDFACEKLTNQWTSFGVKPEDMKRNLGKN